MLLVAVGLLFISSGALCAPSDAIEVGVCNGDGCSALKSSIGATEKARKGLGCCTHADCPPSVTTVLCAHDVITHFFQNADTSKVCSDFNKQCEALRVVKMNLQLSSNILGCQDREERAFLSASSASTRKVLEDLLPQTVVAAFHNALPAPLHLAKVNHAVETDQARASGVALAQGHSNHKGNVYFFDPPPAPGPPPPPAPGPPPPPAPGRGLGWGAICADGFTHVDANTVCKQLGFAGAKAHYGLDTATGVVVGDTFGPVPAPYQILFSGTPGLGLPALAGPQCRTFDATLLDCPGYNPWTAPNTPNNPNAFVCNTGQIAGVECEDQTHH